MIRPERPDDADAVRAVNDAAFSQPNEARLVDALRGRESVVSLVADLDPPSPAPRQPNALAGYGEASRVVGHILFSRIAIEPTTPALALAPMAVLPAHQRRGIGSALVRRGLDECARLGHRIVVVLGHPAFYPRFGFVRARPLGILPPLDWPDDAWMVMALVPGALHGVHGTVRYPPAFDGV